MQRREPLACYLDVDGRAREVILRAGFAGSVLVLDRDVDTREDPRLLARLGADEPIENAALVCREYLRAGSAERCRCRRVTEEDARKPPLPSAAGSAGDRRSRADFAPPRDSLGATYALEPLRTRMSIPELRWMRRTAHERSRPSGPVSLREAIGCLERYEPMIALTGAALARHERDPELSSTVLRAEFDRVQRSPIVLNRRLREVVLRRVASGRLSMSEIAIRCGRIKRDRRGNESGETSWLARRVGILPECGKPAPTPWIHSDVLALIARSGLGVSPREVEV